MLFTLKGKILSLCISPALSNRAEISETSAEKKYPTNTLKSLIAKIIWLKEKIISIFEKTEYGLLPDIFHFNKNNNTEKFKIRLIRY